MKKQLLLSAASVLTCVLLSSCASSPGHDVEAMLSKSDQGWSTLPDYERGKLDLQVGDYGLAIDAFVAELDRHPNSVRALNGQAIAYDRIGRRDVAESLFGKALAVDPASVETLSNLSFFHLRHGETEKAAEFAKRAKVAMDGRIGGVPEILERVVADNDALIVAAETRSRDVAALPAPVSPLQRAGQNQWDLDLTNARMEFSPLEAPASPEMRMVPAPTVRVSSQSLPPVAEPQSELADDAARQNSAIRSDVPMSTSIEASENLDLLASIESVQIERPAVTIGGGHGEYAAKIPARYRGAPALIEAAKREPSPNGIPTPRNRIELVFAAQTQRAAVGLVSPGSSSFVPVGQMPPGPGGAINREPSLLADFVGRPRTLVERAFHWIVAIFTKRSAPRPQAISGEVASSTQTLPPERRIEMTER